MLGIQGNASGDAKYLQAGATAKHFFMFNYATGINSDSVNVSVADLRLTYLPAFKTLVQEGRVESVMCSYKSVPQLTTSSCGYVRYIGCAAVSPTVLHSSALSGVVSVPSMVHLRAYTRTCSRCCVTSGASTASS